MTDLQEYLCQLAEDNYERKIEEITEMDIIRIENDWVVFMEDGEELMLPIDLLT